LPKYLEHVFIWEEAELRYQLRNSGQPKQWYSRCGDEGAFSCWLDEHSAFAFVGQYGRISVLKEARRGDREYWYACRTHLRHTYKRYLGPSSKVTFLQLEEVAKELSSSPAPIPPFPPSSASPRAALLGVKFSPPRPPLALVERERLLHELDAVLTHPLTLVSASAGSGKTTLLSAWVAGNIRSQAQRSRIARGELALAWLSLEELDNDPIRFWTACIAALRRSLPTLGQPALALLHAQEALPLATCLISLLHEIEQVDKELLLILDDYHVITDEKLCDSMHFLLDHMPANLHLILATRIDPELPLSRLRVRDQLLEIRDLDLRFTREEAATFLRERMSLPLSTDEVAVLQTRTEGWIGGLQLAALSLSRREDLSAALADFTGSHRFVLDYVQQDILARLPEQLQDFVLATSILTRMHAASCQAVTVLPSALACQELLETLERAHLFVVPLDEHRSWYRYHDLFREALHARLMARQPERALLLHLRAARWYEAAGEWWEAIAHALLASDHPYAASLMEQAAPAFWHSGEGRTVQNWVLALPDPVLCEHARLALSAALHVLYSIPVHVKSVVAEVERSITRLEGLLQSSPSLLPSDAEVKVVERRLLLLRAFSEARAILQQNNTEHLLHLAEMSEALPADEEVSWNLIPLSLTYWLTDFSPQSRASLIPRLLVAKQQALQEMHYPAMIRIMSLLGEAYIKNGQLRQARRHYQEALALIERSGVCTSLIGSLYLELFTLSYAQNHLEEAATWLHQALSIAHDWCQPYLQAQGEIGSMRLALAKRELCAAEEALQRLEALLSREEFPHSVPQEEYVLWKSVSNVQYWLASRNLTAASAWAAPYLLSPQTWELMPNCEVLVLLQVLLAQQQYSQAVEVLLQESERLCESADIQTRIQFLALSVVALTHAGQREDAWHSAERLFALTEPEGSIRVYLELGQPMKQALKMLREALSSAKQRAAATRRPYVSRLLAIFEQEEQRGADLPDEQTARCGEAQPSIPSLLGVAGANTPALLSPLTPQELSVLRELAVGRSNREIASALVISLNTVKSHVKHLYSKLAVNSRVQACARARDLHLL
jgi:LuxR family maltose regulon positive regulatory protein